MNKNNIQMKIKRKIIKKKKKKNSYSKVKKNNIDF